MKKVIILISMIFVTSCAMTTTTVYRPGGKEIMSIKSKSNAKVVYKKGDESFEVDNTGGASLLEQAITGAILAPKP